MPLSYSWDGSAHGVGRVATDFKSAKRMSDDDESEIWLEGEPGEPVLPHSGFPYLKLNNDR